MRRALLVLLVLGVAGAVAFYLLTIPVTVPASALPDDHAPDVGNGKTMFIAGGCAECHAVPAGACDDLDIKDETSAGGRATA